MQAAILAVLALEAGVGVFGWWGDNGGGGGGGNAVWKAVVGRAKGVVDGDVKGGRMWKSGVRNEWCVFALVCLEGICGRLA